MLLKAAIWPKSVLLIILKTVVWRPFDATTKFRTGQMLDIAKGLYDVEDHYFCPYFNKEKNHSPVTRVFLRTIANYMIDTILILKTFRQQIMEKLALIIDFCNTHFQQLLLCLQGI